MPLGGRLGDRIAALIVPKPAPAPPRRAELPFPAFENYVKGLVAAMPAAAQRFLESAMTLAPHDGRVLTALWTVYTDQGQHEKALGAASAVAADAPELRHARLNAALSLIELKRYDGAERMLTALGKDAPSAAVWNALGIVALRRQPSGTGAIPHFARAVADRVGITGDVPAGPVALVAHEQPDEIPSRARTGVRDDLAPAAFLDRHPVERPRQNLEHRA